MQATGLQALGSEKREVRGRMDSEHPSGWGVCGDRWTESILQTGGRYGITMESGWGEMDSEHPSGWGQLGLAVRYPDSQHAALGGLHSL